MNAGIITRVAIYMILAAVLFAQEAIRGMPEFDKVTAKDWALFWLGLVGTAAIPLRAFIDQSISRQNGNNSTKDKG